MPGSSFLRWITACLLMWALSAGAAEEVNFESGQLVFRVKTWTSDDELPVTAIHQVKQTRDGYLWLATYYGLTRFDGVSPTTFREGKSPGMRNETITSLVEDQQGVLWIGTRDGLLKYRGSRFQRFGAEEGLPDPLIWRVANCSLGGIWVQSADRVYSFRNERFKELFDAAALPFGAIINFEEGEPGKLNIMTTDAWLEIDEHGNWRTNCVRPKSSAQWAGSRLGRTRAECWVASASGVSRIQRSDGVIKPIESLGTNGFGFIAEDHSGNLWAGGAVSVLGLREGEQWRPIDLGRALVGEIRCMEQDMEGNTWLGTDQGLVRLRTAPARSFTRREGLSDNSIFSVCEGSDGTIWLGTARGLSSISPEGRPREWSEQEPAPAYADRCVWPSRSGGVFVAKQTEGLFEYREGQFKSCFPFKANWSPLPTALCEDASGSVVMGTSDSVVVLGRPDPNGRMRVVKSYQVPEVRGMVEEADGTVWMATKGLGLARWRAGEVKYFNRSDGLTHSNLWAIHRGSDGALWLATEDGLTRLLNGKFAMVGQPQGLLEQTVNCILEDDFGYFWLAGLHGIYRVRGTHLKTVADGHARYVQVQKFGPADGMAAAESNGETQPAGWKGRDGRLWFATIRGVVVIDPQKMDPRETAPEVAIERLKTVDRVIWGDEVNDPSEKSAAAESPQLEIAAGQGQMVEIAFRANTLTAPDRVVFKYRLFGVDSVWRTTRERTATYHRLRPAKYHFEVIACNHHNLWGTKPTRLDFQLQPYFWETWPFYVLCGLAVTGLGVMLLGYRLRWQHRLFKMEEQKALAVERARIARDLHDDLGTALTGLALELDVIGRDAGSSVKVPARLNEAAGRARGLAERMREVVWTVNPRCDTVSSLADFLQEQATQFFRGTDMMVRLDFPEDIPALPIRAEARHQLALSVREALNNIVRHAAASEVVLGLAISHGKLTVQIRDNGKGFQPPLTPGLGLENMRARLEQAGGTFEVSSVPGAGTILNFRLPLENGAGAAGGILRG